MKTNAICQEKSTERINFSQAEVRWGEERGKEKMSEREIGARKDITRIL